MATTHSPAENFRLVSSYMGWGDPDGHGLWFIGLEEGSYTYSSAEEIRENLKTANLEGEARFGPCSEPSTDGTNPYVDWAGPIPNWVSKIAVGVSRSNLGWREYRNTKLWTNGSHVFNGNLYPLPKQRLITAPDNYRELFGITDFASYYETGCVFRHELMRTFWRDKAPAATVCFGKKMWHEFKKVLQLGDKPDFRDANGNFETHRVDGAVVLLSPFFGNGAMSNARAGEIVSLLKTAGVSIP